MQLPASFKAGDFNESIHPKHNVFESSQFNSSQEHEEAEVLAKKLVIDALTAKYKQPCISRYDLGSRGYLRRNGITLEEVQAGKYRVV